MQFVKTFFFALTLFLLKLPISGLEAKWTPATKDDDGPLPLSQRYRDKLMELREKVGPERFREMTGLNPSALDHTASTGGTTVDQSDLQHVVRRALHLVLRPAIIATVSASFLAFKAWSYSRRTGCMVWQSPHISVYPPPRRHIREYLKRCAQTTSNRGSLDARPLLQETVCLGHGNETLRIASRILHSLRMCERHDCVEVTNLDFVGLPGTHSTRAQKLVAVLSPLTCVWMVSPYRVVDETRGDRADSWCDAPLQSDVLSVCV